jgi:hypothetical protein
MHLWLWVPAFAGTTTEDGAHSPLTHEVRLHISNSSHSFAISPQAMTGAQVRITASFDPAQSHHRGG